MRSKHHVVSGIVFAVIAFSAMPAMANHLTSASATADCNGYALTVNASALTIGVHYTINYSFTLNCGGTIKTVPGSISFTATATTATEKVSVSWPSAPLTTNCTVTGTATLTNSGSTVDIVINGGSSATLSCSLTTERMTGGGSVEVDLGSPAEVDVNGGTDPLTKVTHGFEIYCGTPPTKKSNLEVNWPHNHFHLENLTSGVCVCNGTLLPPDNPDAGFNEFIGLGTGKLDGVEGASISFDFTDQGEPGTNDTEAVTIKDASGTTVLSFPTTNLTFGNHQAHRVGGPKVAACKGNGL